MRKLEYTSSIIAFSMTLVVTPWKEAAEPRK